MTGVPEGRLHACLLRLSRTPRPWAQVEAELTGGGFPGVQLGGDPMRPYLVRDLDGLSPVTVSAVRRFRPGEPLPDPPLIAELLSGRYGPPMLGRGLAEQGAAHCPDAEVVGLRLPGSLGLAARLKVPDVLLVGLGDRDRYRGARLPLGVARLASWLRFTHAGRVQVVDYALTPGDPLGAVLRALVRRPAVVGVGVNFGQWRMLADLAELLEQETAAWQSPPVVVLGNILAAFSPEEAAKPFKRALDDGRVLVATGLGERPLEQLCRSLDDPQKWAGIDGLGLVSGSVAGVPERASTPQQDAPLGFRDLPGRGTSSASHALHASSVPSLVAPDDSLVLAVAAEGGQVSLETSLGCQFGACTFCPRQHKGEGWVRGSEEVCVAILERFSRLRAPSGGQVALSLVDEEFFGAEGLQDPPPSRLPAARILTALKHLGLRFEVYTRLEQLFDRRQSDRWNLRRASLLADAAPHMRRLFAGVESGSPTQLRRYGKGQTVAQTVDALRVASTLGIPLEFGFITFDPLLTPAELAENMAFLARTDVMCDPHPSLRTGGPTGVADGTVAAVAAVGHYLNGASLAASGEPVYRRVAYMATELEVLANSRYADHLRRRHPDLLEDYDPAFCRFGARYADERVGAVASWCRVWTEGMFTPVYAARMAARSAGPGGAADAEALVRRYRDATFGLLCELTRRHLPDVGIPDGQPVPGTADEPSLLEALSESVTGSPATFDLTHLERHRDR
ncbi:hypothetical protein GCM10010191_82530 [Actinomadura vinacea]|uniref:Elp3/MiaA/NifB-like radical SAM core domain-containing protein n=1 Tax=Actinomadura vinacea TaxID=115336 RepID=A0ABN3K7L8_9ACTN